MRLVHTIPVQMFAGAAILALAGCGSDATRERDAHSAAPVAVEVAIATAQERPVALTLDGTLAADEESRVTAVVPGRVVEVLVERGDVVEEGAPLVRLRDVDYRLQARAARAQVEQARARLGMEENGAPPRPEDTPEVRAAQNDLDLATSTLERSEALAQRGALSQQTLDEIRSRAAAARDRYQQALNGSRASLVSLESARVAMSQASTSASEATVRAPFAGEIADRMISVGEYVAPQTPLVTLVRTNPLRIELSVPQQHLQSVRPGQTVTLTVDAIPDRTFTATVRYVSASVQVATRGLSVEAIIDNSDGVLRPGLFARARLETGTTERVAVVPAAAVYTQAGVDRVFIVRDDTVEEHIISVAERNGDHVVVAEGVAPGDTVATSTLDQLADGVSVTVTRPASGTIADTAAVRPD